MSSYGSRQTVLESKPGAELNDEDEISPHNEHEEIDQRSHDDQEDIDNRLVDQKLLPEDFIDASPDTDFPLVEHAAKTPRAPLEQPETIIDQIDQADHDDQLDQAEAKNKIAQNEEDMHSPVAPLSQRQGHVLWLDLDADELFPKDARPRPQPDYPLHKAIFHNDAKMVKKILNAGEILVAQRDMHGNTPLHLSLMMGHRECTRLLLAYYAPVKIKNKNGWTPMHEAVSYGDRETITTVLKKMKIQSRRSIHGRRPSLIASLNSLRDFYLEMRWEFRSWIPGLTSMLPSDVCKIYKKKGNIRMDTTLIHFNEENWERGDMSFIFRSEDPPDDSLIVLDNIARVFQKVRTQEADFEIEPEVDIVMSSDIVNAKVSMATINFRRQKTGWIWKQERSELIGKYHANFFHLDGLYLENRVRREHLTSEDVRQNRKIIENFRLGSLWRDEEWRRLHVMVKRKSLPKPPPTTATWEDYICASPGRYPCLGRPMILKEWVRLYKASVAMTDEFPLSIDNLLDILEIVAPFKHLNKLRLFCQIKLPPGFPIQVEIPLLATVSARITFQKLQFRRDINDAFFTVPKSYCEEAGHFPML